MEAEERFWTVSLSTKTPYALPTQSFMIPTSWARYHFSQLVNKVLELPKPVPFDFLIQGQALRGSLGQWCTEKQISPEDLLEIEYVESILPPQRLSSIETDNWVSAVSCQLPGRILSSSYDGTIQLHDASQTLLSKFAAHSAPVTSACWIIPSAQPESESRIVATASHDTTAQLTNVNMLNEKVELTPLASLQVHTAPVSSIASSPSGSKCITASWDALLAIWTTSIPKIDDDIPEEAEERGSKRRKTSTPIRRKAPVAVLKSHTGRISEAAFQSETTAISCGWDSTVRTWEVEAGVCMNTITAAEKPFTALSVRRTQSQEQVFVTSTDRTLSLYDTSFKTATSAAQVTFMHPSVPSCVTVSPSDEWRVLTGCYDGIARIWDIRSTKVASSSFRAFDVQNGKHGDGKILSLDWCSGMVVLGGEGGMEVWQVSVDGDATRMETHSS